MILALWMLHAWHYETCYFTQFNWQQVIYLAERAISMLAASFKNYSFYSERIAVSLLINLVKSDLVRQCRVHGCAL